MRSVRFAAVVFAAALQVMQFATGFAALTRPAALRCCCGGAVCPMLQTRHAGGCVVHSCSAEGQRLSSTAIPRAIAAVLSAIAAPEVRPAAALAAAGITSDGFMSPVERPPCPSLG